MNTRNNGKCQVTTSPLKAVKSLKKPAQEFKSESVSSVVEDKLTEEPLRHTIGQSLLKTSPNIKPEPTILKTTGQSTNDSAENMRTIDKVSVDCEDDKSKVLPLVNDDGSGQRDNINGHENPIEMIVEKLNSIKQDIIDEQIETNLNDDIKKEFFSRSDTQGKNRKLKENSKKRRNNKPSSVVCSDCGVEFCSERLLNIHAIKHSNNKNFACDQCDKKFKHFISLTAHQSVHDPSKQLKCEFCEKSFLYKESLNSHYLTHTGERKFNCKICDKSFMYASNLITHRNSVHKEGKLWKCDVCGKVMNKNSMYKHQLIHSGVKAYTCDLCGRSFNRSANMLNHRETHFPRAPKTNDFECSVCNKSYPYNSSLRKHMINKHKVKYNKVEHAEFQRIKNGDTEGLVESVWSEAEMSQNIADLEMNNAVCLKLMTSLQTPDVKIGPNEIQSVETNILNTEAAEPNVLHTVTIETNILNTETEIEESNCVEVVTTCDAEQQTDFDSYIDIEPIWHPC